MPDQTTPYRLPLMNAETADHVAGLHETLDGIEARMLEEWFEGDLKCGVNYPQHSCSVKVVVAARTRCGWGPTYWCQSRVDDFSREVMDIKYVCGACGAPEGVCWTITPI